MEKEIIMKNLLRIWIKKNRLKLYLSYFRSKNTNYFSEVDKSKKKVIVGLAADYSNLGDVAITYAQEKFLMDLFPEYQIVDFPITQTFHQMKELKNIINEDDIITLVGGGNTGDFYDSTEYARQLFIKKFPDNKIVSFPQTIDFSNTKKGKHLFNIAKKVYGNHQNLILMAREEKSYEIYKKNFPNNKVFLFPDIVLYLDQSKPTFERKGITLTLRTDNEKAINIQQQEKMIKELENKYGSVQFYDTDIKKKLPKIQDRKNELKKIWTVFKHSEVVVTDRLHGMVFCAITGTPCVAINNTNQKVSRVYNKWLIGTKFVKMIQKFDVDEIIQRVEEVSHLANLEIQTPDLTDEFEKMGKSILKS